MSSLQPKTPFGVVEETYGRIKNFVSELRELEELDGSDGRPAYDREKLENYMNEKVNNGESLISPKQAYRELYGKELEELKNKPADSNSLADKVAQSLYERSDNNE